jgi:hypothetical protein
MNASHNPNRSLVHIICLSLGGLLVLYSAIAVYDSVTRESVNAAELAIGTVRIALGLVALCLLFSWGRLAEPLQRQVGLMGAAFEADYANLSTKTRIRLIVLVTMLSLLLELVLIRWQKVSFPTFDQASMY